MGISERRPSWEQTLRVQEVESPPAAGPAADPEKRVTSSVWVCDSVSVRWDSISVGV